MSVVLMLAFTWWGFLGFIAIVVTVSGVLAGIEENYGKRAYYIVLFLLGMLLRSLGGKEQRLEEETVQHFMASWSAESKGWPDGEMHTDSMWDFVDFARCQSGDVPNNPYFVRDYRLESHLPVTQVGSEEMPLLADIHTGRKAKIVKAKVFQSDVVLSGQEVTSTSGTGRARAKFWVATDSNQIIKFIFDDF